MTRSAKVGEDVKVANMFMGDNDEAWRLINHSLTLNPRDHLSVRLFRDQLPAYVAH